MKNKVLIIMVCKQWSLCQHISLCQCIFDTFRCHPKPGLGASTKGRQPQSLPRWKGLNLGWLPSMRVTVKMTPCVNNTHQNPPLEATLDQSVPTYLPTYQPTHPPNKLALGKTLEGPAGVYHTQLTVWLFVVWHIARFWLCHSCRRYSLMGGQTRFSCLFGWIGMH